MEHRRAGKTEIGVSLLGFGAMRLPGKNGRVLIDESVELLVYSFDKGINLVDTAIMYCQGRSEEIVGKSLKETKHRIYVSTKNNHYQSVEEWKRYLFQSIERLGIERIDFYHFHSLNYSEFEEYLIKKKVLEEVRKYQAKGYFSHLGFSSHDTPENIKKLIDTGEFEAMIVQYNILDRKNQEVIYHAHKKGMGVFTMGSLGGGRVVELSGKSGIERKKLVELGFKFVVSHPGVSSALSGMGDKNMVRENVEIFEKMGKLEPEDTDKIMKLSEEFKGKVYCTGCRYCLPCEQNVNIPENLFLWNYYLLYNIFPEGRYKELESKGESFENCIECGVCEEKCPQKLPIREIFKKLKKLKK